MSAPIFPDIELTLDILMGELPEGVYAEDRADDPNVDRRSYSSSELRAAAQVVADLYGNLADIYADKFANTVTPEGISSWEHDLFDTAQDSSLPFSQRKQAVLAKVRAIGGISLPAIKAIVDGILTPLGLAFEILPFSGQSNGVDTGAWILESSLLGFGTYLAGIDPILGVPRDGILTPLDCSLDYAAAGLTHQQLLDIQSTAYTYEVRIFGNASASTLALLDKQLTSSEPARSTHVIMNNVSTADDPGTYGWNTDFLYYWVA
jgi:hypothetical protein